MILITCVDNNMGVAFNNRRQSRDKLLIEDMVSLFEGKSIMVSEYSAPLFEGISENISVDNDFFEKASDDTVCFVEKSNISQYEERIDKLVIYGWNRDYPADIYLGIDVSKWNVESTLDIDGFSHDKITRQILTR